MAMTCKIVFVLACLTVLVKAQRPFYAGLSAIGYPEVDSVGLSNRFGEDERAPIEAKGDRNLVNRLNSLPIDNRPFWFINWEAYENLRKNPQTYPQRPNSFINNN
ncbi:hypothetical protein O3G_MSEX005754 [Manduca sexta]|uniref:Seminal fluid protein HACP044 n=1 Tax=Manduca sexta TaxID=7130 RepID=A0A922CJ85_MANSE|nr:hypothetical protein O3G_MSEX005754 [Manduca sexta]